MKIFLSHGIKIFILGQNFLSHSNKIHLTPKFSEKDEISAKASLASHTTLSSSSMAIGKGRKGG